MNMLLPDKNAPGKYKCVRQLLPDRADFRVCGLLPMDIEIWIRQNVRLGYEIGIFEMDKKITIYKTMNFKGYEDYNNVRNNNEIETKG
jgi:hypothetical protein